MFQRVNLLDFLNAFEAHNRGDAYSYEGLEALFNTYEDLEEDLGKPWELDVIGICCDWTEYDNLKAVLDAYDLEGVESVDDLQDYTRVISNYSDSDSVLIMDF